MKSKKHCKTGRKVCMRANARAVTVCQREKNKIEKQRCAVGSAAAKSEGTCQSTAGCHAHETHASHMIPRVSDLLDTHRMEKSQVLTTLSTALSDLATGYIFTIRPLEALQQTHPHFMSRGIA